MLQKSLRLKVGSLNARMSSGPCLHQGDLWMHVLWNAGRRMEGDGKPDPLGASFGYAVACRIRPIHLEAKLALRVPVREPDVVEHRCGVKQLRIERQIPPRGEQSAPEINATVKQQVAFGVANELRHLARQFAIRNLYAHGGDDTAGIQ